MSEIFERVRKVIVDSLSVEAREVTLTAEIKKDLKADSLDLVDLVMELEDEFQLEIPDGDAEKIVTVNDIVTYIQTKTAGDA